jgi:hypothetical protein
MSARHLLAAVAAAALAACQSAPAPQPVPEPRPAVTLSQAPPAGAVTAAPTATAVAAALPAPPAGEQTETTCERFAKVPLPAADQPTAAEKAALAKCDGEALYYGIGRPADVEAARKCAYVEREGNDGPPIGGNAILLMVYADGKGVAPNLDLAIRFACEAGFAPAEVSGRVDRLAKAKREGQAKLALDYCEDITSGYMGGFCAKHEERKKAVGRDARKQAATKGMPAAAVAKVDKAAAAFIESRSTKEIDMSGTLRGAFAIEEQATLANEEVATLEILANPSSTPPASDPAKTERALQSSYDRVMKCRKGPPPSTGTVDAAGIKATEILWLSYREAWLALVTAVRPSAPRDVWKAWFSAKRTKMLDDIGCP